MQVAAIELVLDSPNLLMQSEMQQAAAQTAYKLYKTQLKQL